MVGSYRWLTGIFSVFWADIFITGVQDVLVHESGTGSDLSEEADFDRFANLDTLTLLYEDLSSVFAPVLAVKTGNTILFGMMSLFEWLQSCHEIVATGDTGSNNTFCNTGGDSTLDDCGDGVHRANNL